VLQDLLSMVGGENFSIEDLQKVFRLHESLFFNPRMAIHGSFEGRTTLNSLLERWANILIQMLQIDPLKGDMKTLAKYLLHATKGWSLDINMQTDSQHHGVPPVLGSVLFNT